MLFRSVPGGGVTARYGEHFSSSMFQAKIAPKYSVHITGERLRVKDKEARARENLLEKLEGCHSAAGVGKEQPEVLFRHVLTVRVGRQEERP